MSEPVYSRELAVPTAWLIALVTEPKRVRSVTGAQPAEAEDDWVIEGLKGVPEGRRNGTATRLAGHYHHLGEPAGRIMALLTPFAWKCTPPMELDELQEVVTSVSQYNHDEEWEHPVPLSSEPTYGPDFLLDYLPADIREFVFAVAAALHVPRVFVNQLVKGVMRTLAQGRVSVQIRSDWIEPLGDFELDVLASGDGKTRAFNKVFAPLRAYEENLKADSAPTVSAHRAKIKMAEADKKALERRYEKASEGNTEGLYEELVTAEQGLTELEESTPVVPRLRLGDTTPEAMAAVAGRQPGYPLLIAHSEGGFLQTLAGRYSKGQPPNLDFVLSMYDGSDVPPIDRSGKETIYVKPTLGTIHLTPQPILWSQVYGNEDFRDRGLIPRCKVLFPAPLPPPTSLPADGAPPALESAYKSLLDNIATYPLAEVGGVGRAIRLSSEALELFEQFYVEVHRQRRPGHALEDVTLWAKRMPGTAAREAGLLHVMEHSYQRADPFGNEISAQAMQHGIDTAWFYLDHYRAAVASATEATVTRHAMKLLALIRRNEWHTYTTRDAHQALRPLRPEQVTKASSELVKFGWVRRVESGKKPGRPSEAWNVNPETHRPAQNTQNTSEPGQTEGFVSSVQGLGEEGSF
jgi:hypothetical protein